MIQKKIYLFVVMLCAAFAFASCGKKETKWEYLTLQVKVSSYQYGDDEPTLYPDTILYNLGMDGWELVSAVPVEGTTFPNFGDKKYVTGIRDLTATRLIEFILKREYKEGRKEKYPLNLYSGIEVEDSVEVVFD